MEIYGSMKDTWEQAKFTTIYYIGLNNFKGLFAVMLHDSML